MSGPSKPYAALGDATDGPKPVEILYLDRGRLFSYASQLYDGLTLMRRIMSAAERGAIISPDQYTYSREKSEKITSEAGVQVGLNVTGKGETSKSENQNKSVGGTTDFNATTDFFSEEKSELDNLFLLVERELEAGGILKNYDGSEMSGLVRISAPAKLLDSTVMTGVFDNLQTLAALSSGDPELNTMALASARGADLSKLFRFGVPSEFTFYFKYGEQLISAPLHSPHLTLSPAQLRTNFVAGAYHLQMLAFMPDIVSADDDFQLPGLFADMDFTAMVEAITGNAEITVVPIAIYAELT